MSTINPEGPDFRPPLGKPENMTERCTKLFVAAPVNQVIFRPVDMKAIWFVDDHGTKWVRIKIQPDGDWTDENERWIVIPQDRVLWIEQ